eukprot:TRINITY_DN2635_c0_g1_i5.p1 TRINITY_DN2635_c0_g1~~TRINITY_DN2635_c0_g1_i5.p1  ORF type:complete len:340 (-),score=24.70 TRINITY_DN2635_c0_g1_i5:510-1529(-)
MMIHTQTSVTIRTLSRNQYYLQKGVCSSMPSTKLKEYVRLDEKYSSSELQVLKSRIPDLMHMHQRVVQANGLKAQLFGLYAAQQLKPQKIVLIVPGNPGQGLFYVRYVQHLHVSLEGRCDVFVLTLPGFESKPIHGKTRRFSLQNHIETVSELVLELRSEAIDDNLPVSLIGHSIGAYIILHASDNLLRHHNYRVHSLIALYPFFRVDGSEQRQRATRFLCYYLPFVVGIFVQACSYLPQHVLRWIFWGLKFKSDCHNMESMLLLIRKHVALNALYMGMTEFRQLNGPTNWYLLEQFQDRLAVVAAPNDSWFNKQQYEEIQRKLPNVPVRLFSEILVFS